MSIQPINSVPVSFTGKEKKTEKGNTYQKSTMAKTIGFASGVAIAGGLMYSQMRSLKTFKGKRNLIEGFRERGKSLNDVMDRVIERDKSSGKIVPLEKGTVSERTKAIVSGFKTTLAVWGAGITAATTILGNLVDSSINSSRAKKADMMPAQKK